MTRPSSLDYFKWEHRQAKKRLEAMESGKLEHTNEEYFSAIFSFYNTRNRLDMEVSRG